METGEKTSFGTAETATTNGKVALNCGGKTGNLHAALGAENKEKMEY